MTLTNQLVVFGLSLALTFSTRSADAAGLSSPFNVTAIRLFNVDGAAVVTVNGNIPTNCSTKNAFRVTNETVVRAIEAAYLAGKPIRVVTTDSCANVFDNVTEVFL